MNARIYNQAAYRSTRRGDVWTESWLNSRGMWSARRRTFIAGHEFLLAEEHDSLSRRAALENLEA